MSLDKLDVKILTILDKDGRSTESAIAKEVKTSKQVVKYRLKRLEERGIIENYYSMLDVGRLGFDSYYIFLQLTGLDSSKEGELYEKILKLEQVAWLVTGVGRWDSVILFCARSVAEFDRQLSDFKMLLGKHLHEYVFTTLVNAAHISYKLTGSGQYEPLMTTTKNKNIHLDETEKRIIDALSQSARSPITEIAKRTGIPTHTVNYRLRQLRKDNVIQGFKPKVNVQKIGVQWFLLLISTGNVPKERIAQFTSYCKQHKNVYYLTNTVGKYSLMLDIHVKSIEEFREFLFSMKDEFSDVILQYESMTMFEEQLITYTPKIIFT